MALPEAWIDADVAARTLGVSRATVYAYVSRGLIRSQPAAGYKRSHRYSRDDIERLCLRQRARRDPEAAAARTLRLGMPVLESSLTLIDGEMLFYRGHNVLELAQSARSIDEVAALLWTGKLEPLAQEGARENPECDCFGRLSKLPFIPRAQALLSEESAHDSLAFDQRPESVMICGKKILNLLAHAATQRPTRALTVDRQLANAWKVGERGTHLIRTALILCADHELNVSSFAARCIASAGSSPYGVVIGALAALEGPLHGGSSSRIESALAVLRHSRNLRADLVRRLRRGERVDGFGHPLYPHGDPRAKMLMKLMASEYKSTAELGFVRRFVKVGSRLTGQQPNLDCGLAAVSRVVGLPEGSALILFAIGRAIGWIAHAIEQYAAGQVIRPRAKYVGVKPASKFLG